MNIFSEDHPFGRGLSYLMDLLVLNLLWILCSLPIITMGASTAALYDQTMQMHRGDYVGLVKPFFKRFAQYMRRGLGISLIAVAVGAFIAVDFIVACALESWLGILCQIVIIASFFLYLLVLGHGIPAMVRFDCGVKDTLLHGLRYGVLHGIRGVLVVLLNAVPLLLFVFLPGYFLNTLVFWLLVGFALTAYINSSLLVKLLYGPEEEAHRE